ncbi:MAG: PucR family transcriptional regulator ligand-binding domain-containing protein [Chloroflexota bacterium]|nr:PucR family transcriptional regulator ligand-binding domain-containing protein [Chloroflexota bacterium]MDE2948253.1 PucR family transcriptional regulator ligand-binding domain-containing protein [Chloroflexota bacterium]
MLTLRDALQLPILSDAKVVAGVAGLERPIRWVYNAGGPNAADWLHGGELVLTTVYNMPDSPAERGDYLRQLADKGIVALVITIGMLVDEIPDYLRVIGDELGLPLIELPYQTRFVDIAKVINERISEENLGTISRALSIQQRLSRLVLEGGGFPELAEMLADQVGHSISIENDRFEAIANKNIAEVDSARRYTIEHGRTNPLLIEALAVEYLPKIRASLRPAQLPVMPQLGLEMERLLAPIVVHGDIYGYIWIIADVHALSPIDMMAIEIGATVAALLMLYQESLQTAEASLKGSLMAQLIEGDGGRQTILSDQSLRYGVDLRLPYRMLLASIRNGQPPQSTRAYRLINQVLAQNEAQAVAAQFAGQVAILAQADQPVEELARVLLKRLAADAGDVSIGVSSAMTGGDNVGAAHQQCNEALDIAQRLKSAGSVHHFDELGYIHTLFHAGAASLSQNPQVPILRRLLAERSAYLFDTLEAYLDAGGNSVQTAVVLHIHRSTLNYRLARIKTICDVDLASASTRLNLQIALKLMRLFDDVEGS